MEPFRIVDGYDRNKKRSILVRNLSYEEMKALSSNSQIMFISNNGEARRAKVTSVKRWKTRPDVEVHIKYGMYEFGVIPNERLIKEVPE